MKPLSLRETATRFGINDLPIIFRQQNVAIWGLHLSEKILGPDETFANKVQMEVYNSMVNFYQPFQRPLEVQKQFLRCIRTTDSKRLPNTDYFWVRVSLDRTQDAFQEQIVCTPLLYFGYTLLMLLHSFVGQRDSMWKANYNPGPYRDEDMKF